MKLSDNNKSVSSALQKYKWLGILLTVIVCCTSAFFLSRTVKNWCYIGYYYLFERDSFSANDKVYASGNILSNKRWGAVALYKKIRPFTEGDMDNRGFTDGEREQARKVIDTLSKELVIECHKLIYTDTLRKYRTAYLGSFIANSILTAKADDSKDIKVLFYQIKPNSKALHEEPFNYDYTADMPKYYTWVDSNYYVNLYDVTNKEWTGFTKQ